MPRDITVTFDDGSTHVYRAAPDNITPDAVTQRAAKDFGKSVTALDGGRQSGGASPQPDEPSFMQNVGNYVGGLHQSLYDIPQSVAVLGAMGTDALGITSAGGLIGNKQNAAPQMRREFRKAEPGKGKYFDVGRVVGDIGVTAPLAALKPFQGAGYLASAGNGFVQGLTGAALTSQASDLPLSEQLTIGGGAGAGFGLAGRGLGALYSAFRGREDDALKAGGKLVETLGRDSISSAADVAPQLADNAPMTLMDVAGDNSSVRRLGRALVTMPGPASAQVTKFLQQRSAQQSKRVMEAITGNLSKKTDVYGIRDDLIAARSQESRPLWDEAMNRPAVITDRLQQFREAPELQAGFKRGITLARREALAKGEPFDPSAYAITGFNEAGDPIIGAVPTWRTWQAGKEGIDAMLDEMRDKVTGRLPNTKDANSLKAVQSALLRELDAVNPDYKVAREAWSGPSQTMDAMRMGEDIFKLDPEQITSITSRMSPGDLDFYRVGAARALQDKVRSASDNADLSKRIFGNEEIRSQIEAAFGKNAAARFKQAMDREKAMAETKQFILGNSTTANKMADLSDLTGPTTLGQLLNDAAVGFSAGGPKGAVIGPMVGAGRRLAQDKIGQYFNRMPEPVALSLADLVTMTGPKATEGTSAAFGLIGQAKEAKAARDALIRSRIGSFPLVPIGTGAAIGLSQ